MILLFHNILNKVTSSTFDLGTKKSSCLHQATTHSKVQHSGYKWPLGPLYCGRFWGNASWKPKTECLLLRCFSAKVRNDFCVTVQLWRPCQIQIIFLKKNCRKNENKKRKIKKKYNKKQKKNNIPYMPLLEG